jgi:hypothetical protein
MGLNEGTLSNSLNTLWIIPGSSRSEQGATFCASFTSSNIQLVLLALPHSRESSNRAATRRSRPVKAAACLTVDKVARSADHVELFSGPWSKASGGRQPLRLFRCIAGGVQPAN